MSTTRVRIDPDDPATLPEGRIDPAVVDGTTEAEIALQQQEDEDEAMQDMARYARRVRRRLGLTHRSG
jgi:putative transcriptional regulator